MSARPSVVIGLGTTGSQVVAKVYESYKAYTQKTKDNRNAVQFLLVDTADPIKGAEDLKAHGDHLMIGFSQGNKVLKAFKEDPFFTTWWYPDYEDIGSVYPGAGTVPIKGRFAFWVKLGNPSADLSFMDKFQKKALKACGKSTLDAGDQVVVFIVCTLSGGSGAGSFLEAAQLVRKSNIDAQIHGVFLQPEVVHLLAQPAARQHTSANAYGSMIALNYWLTSKGKRPGTEPISPFMRIYGQKFEGDEPPFNVCWLISRRNGARRAMESIAEYQQMCADSISMMVFDETAGSISARFNDFIDSIKGEYKASSTPQPLRYGSFASYALRYHPEKALSYLTSSMTRSAIDLFLTSPEDLTTQAETLVKDYFEQDKLREVDDKGEGLKTNEVTDYLRAKSNSDLALHPVMVTILGQLGQDALNSALILELTKDGVVKGKVKDTIRRFKINVESGLEGSLSGQSGVNYRRFLQSCRFNLYKKSVTNQVQQIAGQKVQVTGLHQLISSIIQNRELGYAYCKRFLDLLVLELPRHRMSLERELKGAKEKGVDGDRDRLTTFENTLDGQAEFLEKLMFRFLNTTAGRREDIRRFEKTWWQPWLALKLSIMAKEEAILFYQALEDEAQSLLDLMSRDIPETLKDLQSLHDEMIKKIYGQGFDSDVAKLEEEAITDGADLEKFFAEPLKIAANLADEQIAAAVAASITNYAGADRTLQKAKELMQFLMAKIDKDLSEQAGTRFKDKLEETSLWEMLALGLPQENKDMLRQYIERRIAMIRSRCVPYWEKDPGFNVHIGKLPTVMAYSYDEQALQSFVRKYGIQDLQIEGAATGSADESNSYFHKVRSEYDVSPHELKIILFEGGVPLAYVEEINRHLEDFTNWRDQNSEPCLTDHRFVALLKQIGLPTWAISDLKTTQASEDAYNLMLAEHFGIISSPLVRNLQSSGLYRFEEHRLGKIRKLAFNQLLTPNMRDEILPMIEKRLDQERENRSALQWDHEQLVCFARLQYVIENTPDTDVNNFLLQQKEIMLTYIKINTTAGWDSPELMKKIKDENIYDSLTNKNLPV